MLSYTEIRKTEEARRNDEKPLSVRKLDPETPLPFFEKIPFLGDYIPEGWEDTGWKTIFVETTHVCISPATYGKLWQRILDLQRSAPDHYGLGIVEAGEFHVVIRIYKTDHRDFTHSGELTEDDLSKVGAK